MSESHVPTGAHMEARAHGERPHPTPWTYTKIAVTLALITIVEVAIFYLDVDKAALVSVLILLSGVKFALVVLFYMHLKFESRLFAGLFGGGLLIALSIALALLALFASRGGG